MAGRQRHGEAKIENLHVIAVGHEDVGWLDIAVDDAPGVCSVERIGNLDPDLDHPVAWHRPAADHSRKHLALEQLHHNEVTALVLRNLVDSADVRMVQARRGARFVLKSRNHPLVGRELAGDQLQRHRAAERQIFGLVHLGGRAIAELLEDLVMRNCLASHVYSGSSDLAQGVGRATGWFIGFCNTPR